MALVKINQVEKIPAFITANAAQPGVLYLTSTQHLVICAKFEKFYHFVCLESGIALAPVTTARRLLANEVITINNEAI